LAFGDDRRAFAPAAIFDVPNARLPKAKVQRIVQVLCEELSASAVEIVPDAAPLDDEAFVLSAVARAKLNAKSIIEDDLKAAGGAYNVEQAADLLGVSRQTISAWTKARKLMAVRRGARFVAYPACQFTSRGLVPGLAEVLNAHSTASSWVLLHFLVQPHSSLGGRTPLAALSRGEINSVVRVAERELEQGPA
jgi:excisionase family DNA binding protein